MEISTVDNSMKFDVKLEQLFAVYAASACRSGQYLWVAQREFISSKDGE